MTKKTTQPRKKPEVLHKKLKTVLPFGILKKNPDPQLHQMFKPITNFFSTFLPKKTTQPRKKLKFCMKKCQKNDKKIDQKNHPTPQKTRSFAWKIENRPTYGDFEKKNEKKSRPPTSPKF